MSIYKRDDVNPEWEPIPWDAKGPEVDEQEHGFHQRALKPLVWTKVDWKAFPPQGIFGCDRDWFVKHDIEYFTTFDGEELLLADNVWFGWPDPPRWSLASRPASQPNVPWKMWGSFSDIPKAWNVPNPR